MNDTFAYIGNGEYWWISVLSFLVIVLISGLTGLWNGWKTSTYFLVWNVIAVVVGMFVTSPILEAVESQIDLSNVPIKIAETNPYVGPLILFVIILATNLLAFLIYWFVRKPLKRSIKENKRNGKSNGYTRLIGMGVGVITGLPSAIIMTNYASLTTTDNGFTKFNGAMLAGITGTKFEGFDKTDKDSIKSILQMANDSEQIDEFANIFRPQSDANGALIPVDFTKGKAKEAKEKIEKIFANPTSLKIFDPTKLLDGKIIPDAGTIPDLPIKIKVPVSNKEILIKKLKTIFTKPGTNYETLYTHLFENA